MLISHFVRCLTAVVRSCRTSTRQQTRCTARRDWLLPPTDTLWLPILETTALKSTATCSSSTPPLSSAHKLHILSVHTLTCTHECGATWQICTHPFTHFSVDRPVVVPSVWLTSTFLSVALRPQAQSKAGLQAVVSVTRGELWHAWQPYPADLLWRTLSFCFTFHFSRRVHLWIKSTCFLFLLLIIVGFIDPGCFNVCCSVLGIWNVKMSAFYGNKRFFMIFFFFYLL